MIRERIQASIDVKSRLLSDETFIEDIEKISDEITRSFREKCMVLFCGNGGSAADAQHLAAEFSGRFYIDREPLPAEACHVNPSFLTAVANDYSYEQAYARYVKAVGKKGGVVVLISTSGNSLNIIQAAYAATEKGMVTVAMTGASGGELAKICDYALKMPSEDTPRIQEAHILVGHIICEMVENNLFGR